jgi:hypothetical protein
LLVRGSRQAQHPETAIHRFVHNILCFCLNLYLLRVAVLSSFRYGLTTRTGYARVDAFSEVAGMRAPMGNGRPTWFR